jgi:hypothetical protein
MKFRPIGRLEWALGSRSWADAEDAERTPATTEARTTPLLQQRTSMTSRGISKSLVRMPLHGLGLHWIGQYIVLSGDPYINIQRKNLRR